MTSFFVLLILSACGGSLGSSIEGAWTCEGANVEGSEGSSWDPSEDEITVEAPDGGGYLLSGWSECQPEVDLTASGSADGIEVDAQSCDTSLGYVDIRSMILVLAGDGAEFYGEMRSVVTDPIHLEEDFDWIAVGCTRL